MKQKWVRGLVLGMTILTAGSGPLEVLGAEQTEATVQENTLLKGMVDGEKTEEIPGTMEAEQRGTGTGEDEISGSEIEISGIMEEQSETSEADHSVTENVSQTAEDKAAVRGKLDLTMAYLQEQIQNPIVGTIGGEWSVLAMARYGNLSETAKNNYLSNLYQTLEQNQGILDDAKYTEYSRVILALTSMGIRPDWVSGFNLLSMLADHESVLYQGINGPIFALIALDSHSYEIPSLSEEEKKEGKIQTTRDNLIGEILAQELEDGGWALSGDTSDPDMTAMAIQALAPYRKQNESVAHAVERGISFLASAQDTQGGFASTEVPNLESTAQVLIALSAMEPSLVEDPRFLKEGNSVLDALLSYQREDGSFSHTQGGKADAMATDQGALALLAYIRGEDGLTSLYDMTDIQMESFDTEESPEVVAAFKEKVLALPVQVTLQDKDTVYQLLSEMDLMGNFPEKEELRARLNDRSQEIKRQEQQVQALDTAIWNQIDPLAVTLKDKKLIGQLMEQYSQIPEENKAYLKNQKDLLRGETIIEKLEQGILGKEVFENVKTSSKDYIYPGEGYTILLSGKIAYDIRDMNARAESSYEGNIFTFQIMEEGKLPGILQFEFSCELPEGWYQLEHKEGGSYQQKKKVYVKNDTFTVQTDQGGEYRLTAVSESNETWNLKGILEEKLENKKNGIISNLNDFSASRTGNNKSLIPKKTSVTSNVVNAEVKDNLVSKEQVEKVKGTDKNLVMKGTLEDGKEYRMILHGKDVKEVAEINIGIKKTSKNDDNIKLLSEDPEILSFQQEGAFPGEVQVQIPTDKKDGKYLLLLYDEGEGKAEVIQKIEVKDKSTKFVIKKGGDYFIDTRAKAKSVQELRQEDDENWETLSVKDTDDSEEYFIGQGEAAQKADRKLWGIVGIFSLSVLAGVIFWGRKYLQRKTKKGKEKNDKEI